jgi:hypothetical protein
MTNGRFLPFHLIGSVAICLSFCLQATADEGAVRIAEEQVVIPTYEIGPADPNPMFYTNESYQGAQKRIYPYALQDHLTHNKVNKQYTSLVLENDFLELSVLPEIGGRLFSAVDKTNGYDFFYHQHVEQTHERWWLAEFLVFSYRLKAADRCWLCKRALRQRF